MANIKICNTLMKMMLMMEQLLLAKQIQIFKIIVMCKMILAMNVGRSHPPHLFHLECQRMVYT